MNVVNKRTHRPTANDIYIGRGSVWGNPFVIGKDGERAEVIKKYVVLMDDRLSGEYKKKWIDGLEMLREKNLVCFCAPQACHGHVLEKLVEELE